MMSSLGPVCCSCNYIRRGLFIYFINYGNNINVRSKYFNYILVFFILVVLVYKQQIVSLYVRAIRCYGIIINITLVFIYNLLIKKKNWLF